MATFTQADLVKYIRQAAGEDDGSTGTATLPRSRRRQRRGLRRERLDSVRRTYWLERSP